MSATSSKREPPGKQSGVFTADALELASAAGPPASTCRASTVLIVDDDDDLAEALAVVLEQHGFASKRCQDAVAALEALQREELPDLILLDLMMPRMDGWEFRALQRSNSAWASIPVVALTGNTSAQAAVMD